MSKPTPADELSTEAHDLAFPTSRVEQITPSDPGHDIPEEDRRLPEELQTGILRTGPIGYESTNAPVTPEEPKPTPRTEEQLKAAAERVGDAKPAAKAKAPAKSADASS